MVVTNCQNRKCEFIIKLSGIFGPSIWGVHYRVAIDDYNTTQQPRTSSHADPTASFRLAPAPAPRSRSHPPQITITPALLPSFIVLVAAIVVVVAVLAVASPWLGDHKGDGKGRGLLVSKIEQRLGAEETTKHTFMVFVNTGHVKK